MISISSWICGPFFIRLHWLVTQSLCVPIQSPSSDCRSSYCIANALAICSYSVVTFTWFFRCCHCWYSAILNSCWCWSFHFYFFLDRRRSHWNGKNQEPFIFELAGSISPFHSWHSCLLFFLLDPDHVVWVWVCEFVWLAVSLVNGSSSSHSLSVSPDHTHIHTHKNGALDLDCSPERLQIFFARIHVRMCGIVDRLEQRCRSI